MNGILSVYRHEDKFCMDHASACTLRKQLSKVMDVDEHSCAGGYRVRSLYFDSVNNTDYNQKFDGIEKRKKIRLRIYDADSNLCKLEMKEKIGVEQHKTSLLIERAMADDLMRGNFSALLDRTDNVETALRFYKTMMLGTYRPATIIEYKRIAYACELNRTRLTFDYDITASEKSVDLFVDELKDSVPILNDFEVFEVKYDGKLPEYIAKVLSPFNLCQTSYSKYCYGRINWDDFL